jgi:hypothetical protein
MKRSHRTSWLAAAVLAALISSSIAAPHTFGWSIGLATAANEGPDSDESTPDEGRTPDETEDLATTEPIDEEPTPDPGEDPGEGDESDESPDSDVADEDDGADTAGESEVPATPATPTLTLGDLLAATSASAPFDADLALRLLREYAPPGARAIEVADRPTFRDARTYSLRDVQRWSRLPRLGTSGSLVWIRFVGGPERTPFAVAAGRDRSDPRISSVRVREGRATRGNPPPYLLTVTGSDTETGVTSVEVRVGYERPLRFGAGEEIEIGPFMKTTGGRVVLLMRGETVQVRLIDAAGNASSWRNVRLP